MREQWQPIPEHEGYEASTHGRVRRGPRVLRPDSVGQDPAQDGSRYQRVRVGGRKVYVHLLVFSAFYGALPPGHTVDHVDRNRANNRPENLRAATRADQVANRAKATEGSKLSHEVALEIHGLQAEGVTVTEIAVRYGITRRSATRVCNGRSYVDAFLEFYG